MTRGCDDAGRWWLCEEKVVGVGDEAVRMCSGDGAKWGGVVMLWSGDYVKWWWRKVVRGSDAVKRWWSEAAMMRSGDDVKRRWKSISNPAFLSPLITVGCSLAWFPGLKQTRGSSLGFPFFILHVLSWRFRMLVDYDARNYFMTAGIVGPEAWRRKFYQDEGGLRSVAKSPPARDNLFCLARCIWQNGFTICSCPRPRPAGWSCYAARLFPAQRQGSRRASHGVPSEPLGTRRR